MDPLLLLSSTQWRPGMHPSLGGMTMSKWLGSVVMVALTVSPMACSAGGAATTATSLASAPPEIPQQLSAAASSDPAACTLEAVAGAPRLTVEQAQALMGTDIRYCLVDGSPLSAREDVLPAADSRVPGFIDLLTFSSTPPEGYQESANMFVYLDVQGQWREAPVYGIGRNDGS